MELDYYRLEDSLSLIIFLQVRKKYEIIGIYKKFDI